MYKPHGFFGFSCFCLTSLCNLLVYHYAWGEIIIININNNNKENLALRDVLNVLKGSYLKLVNQSCTQASYRMNRQGEQVRQIEILERSLVFFFLCSMGNRSHSSLFQAPR